MGKTILLSDLLRLIDTYTEITLCDEYYTILFEGSIYDEDIHKYEDKLILELGIWDDTALYVRIINENC